MKQQCLPVLMVEGTKAFPFEMANQKAQVTCK